MKFTLRQGSGSLAGLHARGTVEYTGDVGTQAEFTPPTRIADAVIAAPPAARSPTTRHHLHHAAGPRGHPQPAMRGTPQIILAVRTGRPSARAPD